MFTIDIKNLLQGFSAFRQGTQLEEKLSDINYPLEDYLNNPDAIQCYKDMKKNAKKYFDKNKIKQLIKYIIEEPENDVYLQGHKYPYIASEMLKSECSIIQDLFVLTEKEYNEKYKEEQKALTNDENSNNKVGPLDKTPISVIIPLKNEENKDISIKNKDNNSISEEKEEKKENLNLKEENSEKKKEEENKDNKNKNEIVPEKINNNENKDNKDKINENKDKTNEKEIKKDIIIQKENNLYAENKNDNINNKKDKEDEENKEDKKNIKEETNNQEEDNNNKNNKYNNKNIKEEDPKQKIDENENSIEKENNKPIKVQEEVIQVKDDIKKSKEKEEINNLQEEKNNNKTEITITNEKQNEEEKNIDKNKNNNNNNNITIIEGEKNINKDCNKNEEKVNNKNDIFISSNELLDLLLNFVINDKPKLNDVLSGYFSSVLITLIDKYSYKILIYLYTVRKDALKKIIFHSYQKSLSLVSLKILKMQNIYSLISYAKNTSPSNVDYYLKIIENCGLYRNELIGQIILSLSLDGFKDEKGNIINDIDIESIFLILYDLVTEIEILKYIVNSKDIYYHILTIIENKVFIKDNIDKNKQYIYKLFIILLTKIFSNMNKNMLVFDFITNLDYKFLTSKNRDILNFFEKFIISFIYLLLFNFIDNSSINNANSPKDIGWGLGLHNIYIMDLVIEVFNYMKPIPIVFDNILKDVNFIQKAIEYFFKYQLNNIYHFKFLKFFKLYLDNESEHSILRDILFSNIKFNDILPDYINQKQVNQILEKNSINKNEEEVNKNSLNNNIDNKCDKLEINSINENEKKYYINKYYYKSGRTTLSCVHSYVIYLIYKIQVKGGLKAIDEKDKNELNIKNIGEFEFVKDETFPKDIIEIKTSEKLNEILKLSSNWINTYESKVLPLIKKYEGNLCPKAGITTSTSAKNAINNSLMKSLMNIIAKNPKIITNKDKVANEKYNDINFWEVKPSISPEIKNKIKQNENNNNNNNNNNIENKDNENKYNENKEIKNKIIDDEEDELLGIAMKLEQKEKTENFKILLKNKSSNNVNNSPSSSSSSLPKTSANNKLNNINTDNSKNLAFAPTQSLKVPISKEKNKDKEEKNSKYNDINYWNIKPESLLKENEINSLLEDL